MKRNPIAVLLLTLLTFGGYWVYWHYSTSEALRQMGEETRPALNALAVSWGLLVLVPAMVSAGITARRVARRRAVAGGSGPNAVLAVVLMIVIPLAGYTTYVQWHLNRVTPDGR